MLFNSGAFFVFFAIVVATFFLTPPRWRWIVLLVASAIFYVWWKPQYLVLLYFSTAVAFAVGQLLGRETRPARRRALLALCLFTNLGLLVVFKYLGLFLPLTRDLFDIALPVGISFYTFQTLGYVIDVYRRQYEPEPHFGRFAVFVSFFPHLVAGPIMRGNHLLPQFRQVQRFDFDRAVSGLGLVAWGLFKKVVIADRAAHYVDRVYASPDHFQGATIVVTTYVFAFQLYGDFSGYSDIAIGTAKILGFDLMQNFDRPFAAPSLMQFWRRWHISFSTWFNDYVYVPLGLSLGRAVPLVGRRGQVIRTTIAVAIVFVLSGLWHGNRWNYVLWGAFMGVVMLVSMAAASLGKRWLRREAKRQKLPSPTDLVSAPYRMAARIGGVILTFHFVCASLLIFRASDMAHLKALALRLPADDNVSVLYELTHLGPAPPTAITIDLAILFVAILVMEVTQWIVASTRHAPRRIPTSVRWLAWSALCVMLLLATVQSHTPFIYFAF